MAETQDVSPRFQAPGLNLMALLRRTTELLDEIALDLGTGSDAVQEAASMSALLHVSRNEMADAVFTLVDGVKNNPLWLRGYVLLASIYQEMNAVEEAIETLKAGSNVCRVNLRYLAIESCQVGSEVLSEREVQPRILRRMVLFRRYEHILRHRLVVILVETGRYEEALRCWAEPESEDYA